MNFHPTRLQTMTLVALATVSIAIPSVTAANGATWATWAQNSQSKYLGGVKVVTILPKVSAHAGVAPVISKPVGAAPKVLISKDIIVGKGKSALTTSTVKAQYVVMSWKTGVVYQTSWTSQPFEAPLSNLILGWQKGIPGMKVGGRRLFVIPPALAYGSQGAGNIPANETLVFVVDLLGVK